MFCVCVFWIENLAPIIVGRFFFSNSKHILLCHGQGSTQIISFFKNAENFQKFKIFKKNIFVKGNREILVNNILKYLFLKIGNGIFKIK